MSRIRYLLLLFIITCAAAAGAAEEKIFSGWQYPGETLVENDMVFSFTWIEDYEELRLRYGDYYKSIDKGGCEILKGTNDTIKACYDRNEYDLSKKEFKAYIMLYLREPEIEIRREFSKTEFYVGEEITVDVSLENKGELTAYDIVYEDSLEDFELVRCIGGCYQEGNTIIWKDSHINKESTETFTYKVKPQDSFERKLTAVLRYNTTRGSEQDFSDSIKVESDYLLGIETKIVDTEYYAKDRDDLSGTGIEYNYKEPFGSTRKVKGSELKETGTGSYVKYLVELTNNRYDDVEKIKVNNLEIRVPNNFGDISLSDVKAYINSTNDKLVGSRGMEHAGYNVYRWKGSIEDRKIFVLKMRAELSGHPSIFTSAGYREDDINISIDDIKDSIEIINVSPEIRLIFEKRDPGTRFYSKTEYFDDDEYRSESNKKEIMKVRLDNPSQDVRLENIKIVIDSGIFNESLEYFTREIGSSESRLLDVKEFLMPQVEKDTTYPFDINITWETEYGEIFRESHDRKVKVESIKDIKATHKFSDSNVDSGQKFYITTMLENTRQNPAYNVTATDDYGGFMFRGGITSQRTDIKEKTKIDAYKYEVEAPEVENKTRMCINTTIDYSTVEGDYKIFKEDCVTVNPRAIDLKISDRIDEPHIYLGEIFSLDYTFKNNDEKSAYDLQILFPPQKYFDIVAGTASAGFSRLDKNEEWKITDKFKIRAKTTERIDFDDISITYRDKHGNSFNVSDKPGSVKVEEQSINSPMLIITKNVSAEEIEAGQAANVTLKIENIGEGVAQNITLHDYGREFKLGNIGDNEVIEYSLGFNISGEYSLGSAKLYYSDGVWNFVTASENASLTVTEPLNNTEEEYTVVIEDDDKESVQKKKGIIKRILDYIASILFWTKEG